MNAGFRPEDQRRMNMAEVPRTEIESKLLDLGKEFESLLEELHLSGNLNRGGINMAPTSIDPSIGETRNPDGSWGSVDVGINEENFEECSRIIREMQLKLKQIKDLKKQYEVQNRK